MTRLIFDIPERETGSDPQFRIRGDVRESIVVPLIDQKATIVGADGTVVKFTHYGPGVDRGFRWTYMVRNYGKGSTLSVQDDAVVLIGTEIAWIVVHDIFLTGFNLSMFYVVGGEYTDSTFTKLAGIEERYGPFPETEIDMQWRGITMRTVDNYLFRYHTEPCYSEAS